MATREIDEEEFLRSVKLRETVAKLMANEQAALLVEQAVKVVDPTAKTPRVEAQQAANAFVDPVKKELEALRKEVSDDKVKREAEENLRKMQATHRAGIDRLRQQGYNAKGIEEIEKIMTEKGIVDHDIAVAYFDKLHPPQNLVTPGGHGAWNFLEQVTGEEDADLKKLIEGKGENSSLLDKMARDALMDIRGQTRR